MSYTKTIILLLLALSATQAVFIKLIRSQGQETFLTQKDIYGKQAEFGYLTYDDYRNSKFLGEVDVPEEDGEDSIYGCTPFLSKSPIVVVRRGKCKFFTKAEFAAMEKAKFLIIVDNIEGESLEKMNLVGDLEKHLPLGILMISKSEGDELIRVIRSLKEQHKKQLPQLIIKLDQIKQSETLQVDYWFSSLQPSSYQFFNAFETTMKKFALSPGSENTFESDKIYFQVFTPLQFHNKPQRNHSSEDCIYNRYCSLDPDGLGALNGRDTLEYDIKFQCASQLLPSQLFLNFANLFKTNCLDSPEIQKAINQDKKNLLDTCFFDHILEVFKKYSKSYTNPLVVSQKLIQCFKESFDEEKQVNSILEKQAQMYKEYKVQMWPELYINFSPIHGDISSPDELLAVMCGSFILQSMPKDVCIPKTFKNIPKKENNDSHINPAMLIAVIILASLLILMFGIYFLRRKNRQDSTKLLQNEVGQAVSEYFQIKN